MLVPVINPPAMPPLAILQSSCQSISRTMSNIADRLLIILCNICGQNVDTYWCLCDVTGRGSRWRGTTPIAGRHVLDACSLGLCSSSGHENSKIVVIIVLNPMNNSPSNEWLAVAEDLPGKKVRWVATSSNRTELNLQVPPF